MLCLRCYMPAAPPLRVCISHQSCVCRENQRQAGRQGRVDANAWIRTLKQATKQNRSLSEAMQGSTAGGLSCRTKGGDANPAVKCHKGQAPPLKTMPDPWHGSRGTAPPCGRRWRCRGRCGRWAGSWGRQARPGRTGLAAAQTGAAPLCAGRARCTCGHPPASSTVWAGLEGGEICLAV